MKKPLPKERLFTILRYGSQPVHVYDPGHRGSYPALGLISHITFIYLSKVYFKLTCIFSDLD